MDFIELPVIENIKCTDGVLTPEEYTYWKARESRCFFIDWEIDDDYSLLELGKIIIQLNMKERDIPKEQLKPIYLYIHSYGGDLEQAFAFCDICLASRIPIITVGLGVAMSASFLIFLAGHKRYAFKHCSMLVHSGSAGFQGTAEQIEEAQKNYKKQLNQMKEYILSLTEIEERVFNKNRNKDWYLTPDELVKYHVVDKLIDSMEDVF